MKSSEIRNAYINFFKSKGHTHVPSASLVPVDDPTLLFTNAGMNQFKNCFLGAEKRAYTRAVTCQKVMRISGKHNDLENVGVTARHHTFFEMLGNFSFGDYFKKDAIKFGWEFLTEVLKIPASRLWVTVYTDDDEAEKLWKENTSLLPGRVVRMKDNFWAMGDTGPCGPCTEIHYFKGGDNETQSAEDLLKEDLRYLEIWNIVFMQYNRSTDGTLTPLPKPSVDTGMGFERIVGVMQGKEANYDTDVLRGIISLCEEVSGFKYDGRSYEPRDLGTDKAYARDVAMRVIADHSRAMAFLIADGVLPSSEGRGYVLRRVIRRAIRHGRVLQFKEPFLAKTTARVAELMGEAYPELIERRETVMKVVDAEERKFHETLDSGLAILQKEVEKLSAGQLFPGKVAFLLHDTYGFPLDLTQDALKAYSRQVDIEEFNKEMERQKQRSRDDRKSQGIAYVASKIEAPKTKFLGYEAVEAEATLCQILPKEEGAEGVSLIFDQTPFYAESGGQVGDTGTLRFNGAVFQVLDTQKVQDHYFAHDCKLIEGELSQKLVGQKAKLLVDVERRNRIRAHHSATHLLHAALRKVLGTHVKQAGSRVDENTLRFDYNHFETVSAEQLEAIAAFVNEKVRGDYEVVTQEMAVEEAQKTGAMALFGEKYGEKVRVVKMGDVSLELCGGTHVKRTGNIGMMLVAHEAGIAAGVRRFECWAGRSAEEQIKKEKQERERIADLLKSDSSNLPEKVEKLVARAKALERELESAKAKLAAAASGDVLKNARVSAKGVKVVAEKVDVSDTDTLRTMVDNLRASLGSGVVALAGVQGDKAMLVVGVTADLTKGLSAGNLVKEAAKVCGGKGGGRPDFAQAGGLDVAKLGDAFNKIIELA